MVDTRNLFFIIVLQLVVGTPQINLYFTDLVSESKDDNVIQHDCLRIAASIDESNVNRQIMSYCMSESLLKYNIEKNDYFPKFTFAELSKRNITSQQLYFWSAPIDIIEHYQFYLNQLSKSNNSTLENNVFYNCTLPRFGPICQYEFNYHHPKHSSLYEIIYHFYRFNEYQPTNLTCYTHLKCDRTPFPSCLDWSEICDGKIDCHDGGYDEEYCWELEINECKDNEYRCTNGQCIPQSFYLDNANTPDCLDQSDELRENSHAYSGCNLDEPSFGCEDVACMGDALTSSCTRKRSELLFHALYSIKDKSLSNECWSAFKCVTGIPQQYDPICFDVCRDKIHVNIIMEKCPEIVFFPAVPVLFNDIYFAYGKNDSQVVECSQYWFPYICSNNTRYDQSFVNNSKVIFDNVTCYRSEHTFNAQALMPILWLEDYLMPTYTMLRKYTLVSNYTFELCNRSSMYQCASSPKCISVHRLMDGIYDCPHNDDGDKTRINGNNVIKQSYFKCQTSSKIISPSSISDGKCDCGFIVPGSCEDENLDINYIRRNISFQTICDGYIELLPIMIDGQNETDETECEQWLCNNIYTRCDGLWNCANGEDEVGCYLSSTLNCSSDEHLCVSPHSNQLMCLSINKANNGNVDCLGATDEPNLCYNKYEILHKNNFYCMNDSYALCIDYIELCDLYKTCVQGDDEQFCKYNDPRPMIGGVCALSNSSKSSDVEKFLCESSKPRTKKRIVHFSLDGIENSNDDEINEVDNTKFPPFEVVAKSQQEQVLCHRGLDLQIWLDNKTNLTTTTKTCLCPPSFYGDRCQYQNQRVSLSIQFRAPSNSWQIPFAIIILLIDDNDQRIIHSYEQFTYLSIRDCQIKFNIYLLYSTRPKNQTKSYSIHIDIYEKVSLNYRGSLLVPITFPFLPVHRLAFIIDIPRDNNSIESCSNHQCNHGKCIKYSNNPQNLTFCQCDQGWSGRYCTIPYTCICSSDSLCIGVTNNNRSVCICSLHQFGPRCLIDTICQTTENSTCKNGGQCIPNDEYIQSDQKFTCICPKGFIGKKCEIVENEIILSFGRDIMLTQSIFIHFIQVIINGRPRRSTTFRTIPFKQDSITIHWPQPFHLVFIEFSDNKYYLTIVQKNYTQSTKMIRSINSSNLCRNITDIFNETVVKLDLIRRIKYYQLPCQIYSTNLSCFYDDIHLCLCQSHGQERVANCFEFNHNMTFNCLGQSVCENGAQCFQDTPNCPQRSICICPLCFYGARCQFSTNGFGLSLDAILGYHIQPNVKITQQPSIVQISVGLAMLFIIVGLINGILSAITFQNKRVRDVGCGLYLLGSSITTLLTTIMFGLKFWLLIVAQMGLIENRSFLSFQCHSVDFLLRTGLIMDQWLNACVAIERATTVIKGTRFNKKKSKQAAKLVIIIVLIVTIATGLDDPISRRLIDEENEDEKRIWCIVSYSSSLQTYNYVMHTFHFIAPFIFNFISAIILITKKSRQKSGIQNRENFKQILREQIREHKNLFIAPVILVILAVPRLIISFLSKCMKSSGDSWLFLTGYFISFIPPMLTFVVFILPSKFYKKEFRTTITRYRTNIRKRLYATS